MKTPQPPPKKSREESDKLKVAERTIKELEKRLAAKEEEVINLKKPVGSFGNSARKIRVHRREPRFPKDSHYVEN